jgi:hypothetical protein
MRALVSSLKHNLIGQNKGVLLGKFYILLISRSPCVESLRASQLVRQVHRLVVLQVSRLHVQLGVVAQNLV